MTTPAADPLSFNDIGQSSDPSLGLRILRTAILLSAPQLLGYGVLFQSYGAARVATILYSWSALSIIGGILLLRRPALYRIVMYVECALILIANTVLVLMLGGLDASAGQILWTMMAPVGTLVIFGPRFGTGAFIGFGTAVGVTAALGGHGAASSALPEGVRRAMLILNILLPTSFVFGVLCVYERGRTQLFALLHREHERAEQLLLQMLPENVAERLKREGGPIADSFADVTVMFADISGFTELTPDLPPRHLVEFLNSVFSRFDAIVERYGVEKIKTIGDAYMVVGGLSPDQADHAERMADTALEMIACCATHRFSRVGTPLRLRIGLHTGPVVGGVIGQKRFIYDLWGDTVNLASRMQTRGETGRVQVSQATYRRLRRTHEFEEAPAIQVDSAREEKAYYLVARRHSAASA